MNVFEFCMNMEQEGEQYYRDMAGKCKLKGLKQILNMLADDEVKHYEYFKSLKNNSVINQYGSTIIIDSKNVFQTMKESEKEFNLEGTNIDLFKKAREVELKSESFYKEKAEEIESAEAKELLLKIAEEERSHAHLIDNILVFLSKPEAWVENAEFHHLDEY